MKKQLYFKITDLLNELTGDSIFVKSLQAAAYDGRYSDAIDEIFAQSKDNRRLVSKLVGEELLLKIEKFFSL